VLVSSGGGGPEVCAVLRLLTLPGAQALLHLLRLPTAAVQLRLLVALLRALDAPLGRDAPDLLRVVTALPDATARAAFIRSLRSVVDWRGQVITLLDRCYLAYGMPTLLIWGERDAIVPLEHGYRAHRAMPGSELEIFAGAGHFPFHTEPARFVATVERFLAATQPARWNAEQWRQLLRSGPVTPSAMAEARGVSERGAT
jgi:pimeloyl-ACP methyl ester carboxylesterase